MNGWRLWILRSAVAVLLLGTAPTAAQRQPPSADRDVSASVRLAIADATRESDQAIAALSVDLAVVKKTAEDARDELADLRRAIWAMAGTLFLSLMTQIQQARKSRSNRDA